MPHKDPEQRKRANRLAQARARARKDSQALKAERRAEKRQQRARKPDERRIRLVPFDETAIGYLDRETHRAWLNAQQTWISGGD